MQKENIAKSFRGPRSDHKKISSPLFGIKITGQSHRKACKLNYYWKICGNFIQGPLRSFKNVLRAPFLHQAPLQKSVCERSLRQTNIFEETTTERDLTQRMIIFYLLVSQLVPSNPAAHVQVYVLTPSVQSPPFWQGFGWQSSISKRKSYITIGYFLIPFSFVLY